MSIDKLRELATNKKKSSEIPITATDVLNSKHAETAYKYLDSLEKVDNSKAYVLFHDKLKTLSVTGDTKEELYGALHSLHPESAEASMASIKDSFIKDINSKQTDTEKESHIRNNFRFYPNFALPDIQRVFFNYQRKITAKDYERSAIAQTLDVGNLLPTWKFEGLDTEKSDEAHTRAILNLYHHGLTENIKVVDGNISFPYRDGYRPAYILPDPVDIMDGFIQWNDLAPLVRKKVSSSLGKRRQELQDEEKAVTESLYDSMDRIPKRTRGNIAVDYAMYKENPVKSLQYSVYRAVDTRLKSGELNSYSDIVRAYMEEQQEIVGILAERMDGHGIK